MESLKSLKVGQEKDLQKFLTYQLPKKFFGEFKYQMDYLNAGIIYMSHDKFRD